MHGQRNIKIFESFKFTNSGFYKNYFSFKIYKRNDGAVCGEPKGTKTVEVEITRFN